MEGKGKIAPVLCDTPLEKGMSKALGSMHGTEQAVHSSM